MKTFITVEIDLEDPYFFQLLKELLAKPAVKVISMERRTA